MWQSRPFLNLQSRCPRASLHAHLHDLFSIEPTTTIKVFKGELEHVPQESSVESSADIVYGPQIPWLISLATSSQQQSEATSLQSFHYLQHHSPKGEVFNRVSLSLSFTFDRFFDFSFLFSSFFLNQSTQTLNSRDQSSTGKFAAPRSGPLLSQQSSLSNYEESSTSLAGRRHPQGFVLFGRQGPSSPFWYCLYYNSQSALKMPFFLLSNVLEQFMHVLIEVLDFAPASLGGTQS
eukprot:TRINITY_DN7549_c0_g1_i1.p1 TRINITY_DN7549_c0_g1~~TRINITY_DN7549_c0_g1_i1.p1  ORF type:complete len:235 (-),score=-2.33 TRINITY_DN7549_c0_g1_i1:39-743(-)